MAREPIHKGAFDTIIVGNGPSALILSYILHGNVPYYDASTPHPDPILHAKLLQSPCLLDIDVPSFTAHFGASRLSYSTQALPINVLLDTLIRPLADTEPGAHKSCVAWQYEPEKAVSHVVLGNTLQAGGQWADNPVAASWDIGALSYAEMLSLPGYTFQDHFRATSKSVPAEFHRPTRRDVADYLAAYPEAVGIKDSFVFSSSISSISRNPQGFYVGSYGIQSKHLVLASGVFSHLIPARPQLQPLVRLGNTRKNLEAALLVVGSGFTAADTIITNLATHPNQKIIHIYKWDPEERPSPLRACHPRAYPEYAGVYRRMKLAALNAQSTDKSVMSPLKKSKANPFFDPSTWQQNYEGFPNTRIAEVVCPDDGSTTHATVVLEDSSGRTIRRLVSDLKYHIGRRGSLDYLDDRLQDEICKRGELPKPSCNVSSLSGQSLRSKVEQSLEVAPDVFITGSLTGDSLVRFAFGGCVYAAREIMKREGNHMETHTVGSQSQDVRSNSNRDFEHVCDNAPLCVGKGKDCDVPLDIGKDHEDDIHDDDAQTPQNQHVDLHIDRRETLLTHLDSKGKGLRRPSWWTPSSCTLA